MTSLFKPKYSVMRIEMAKQKALTGEEFNLVKLSKRLVMNWTGEDEAALCDLIDRWYPETGHGGLNLLIDTHPFSGGTQYQNAGLSNLVEIITDDGAVIFKDPNPPQMASRYKRSGY